MSGSSRKCEGGREEWPGGRVGSGAPRTGLLSPLHIHSTATAVAILDQVRILPDPSSIKVFVVQHPPLPFKKCHGTFDLLFSMKLCLLMNLLHSHCSSNPVNCNQQRSNNGGQSQKQSRETPSHGSDIFPVYHSDLQSLDLWGVRDYKFYSLQC